MDCRGFYLGRALAKKVDLGGRKHLLDIGGGSGIYSCSWWRTMAGTAGHGLRAGSGGSHHAALRYGAGYPDRVLVATGDMFKDLLPTDADAHLFSNVLRDWDYPEVRKLLAISHEALAPNWAVDHS